MGDYSQPAVHRVWTIPGVAIDPYLTNDPAACANFHVMSEYYAAWMKGPHRSVAVCNDCHAPRSVAGGGGITK